MPTPARRGSGSSPSRTTRAAVPRLVGDLHHGGTQDAALPRVAGSHDLGDDVLTAAAWLVHDRLRHGRVEGLAHRVDAHEALLLEGAAERSDRSEEHTSELQSLMRTSYAVSCLT